MRVLLERDGIDLNIEDEFDRTPLLWAASKEYEVVVRLLLERNIVDPNHQDAGY